MRIIPTRAVNGQWMDPIPFMITEGDLEDLIKDSGERETVASMLGKRLGNLCICGQLARVVGNYADRDSEERARITNKWYGYFNGTVRNLREQYFLWVGTGDMKAGEQLEYSFKTKDYIIPLPYEPVKEPRQQPEDFSLLLNTRKLLSFLGVSYYDGPEFKFMSNRHPSPAETYIPTLAKEYMMQLVIPNALLALKHGKIFSQETAMLAIDHCMISGKSPESVIHWKELASDGTKISQIAEKYMFYVLGKTRDGRDIKADHRCYLEKYISLKVKDAAKFRKSKNQEVVEGLLKRMESEPELKTMSHRQLMSIGISNRPARMFMEARERG